ncbi:hypothetical protein NITHO_2400010 [Nitrolancea hollandica Lb]|uniref:Uncharacterized protein n=1 Tax=Nitrolancea hollandica Lb TaxID=1129897 RepID=I4EFT8_9BACT|nr:hypothetical protein NITHO_2400010 [Nitrolancea hollandica Lb]
MLGTVAGCVNDAKQDLAERQFLPVLQRLVRVRDAGGMEDGDSGARSGRELMVTGDVVGVIMRFDDVAEAEAVTRSEAEDLVDHVDPGIDDGHFTRVRRPDHVGGTTDIAAKDLFEVHGGVLWELSQPANPLSV